MRQQISGTWRTSHRLPIQVKHTNFKTTPTVWYLQIKQLIILKLAIWSTIQLNNFMGKTSLMDTLQSSLAIILPLIAIARMPLQFTSGSKTGRTTIGTKQACSVTTHANFTTSVSVKEIVLLSIQKSTRLMAGKESLNLDAWLSPAPSQSQVSSTPCSDAR
jgi:hypothetical protein